MSEKLLASKSCVRRLPRIKTHTESPIDQKERKKNENKKPWALLTLRWFIIENIQVSSFITILFLSPSLLPSLRPLWPFECASPENVRGFDLKDDDDECERNWERWLSDKWRYAAAKRNRNVFNSIRECRRRRHLCGFDTHTHSHRHIIFIFYLLLNCSSRCDTTERKRREKKKSKCERAMKEEYCSILHSSYLSILTEYRYGNLSRIGQRYYTIYILFISFVCCLVPTTFRSIYCLVVLELSFWWVPHSIVKKQRKNCLKYLGAQCEECLVAWWILEMVGLGNGIVFMTLMRCTHNVTTGQFWHSIVFLSLSVVFRFAVLVVVIVPTRNWSLRFLVSNSCMLPRPRVL